MRLLLVLLAVTTTRTTTTVVVAFAPTVHHKQKLTELAGIFGRFRKRKIIQQIEPIQVGDLLPEFDVELIDDKEEQAAKPVTIQQVLGNSKSLLIGMPGAFTPVCSREHLPGYIQAASEFQKLGFDRIAVVTTNDKFVNAEWGLQQGITSDTIRLLCDGDGDFVKAIGLCDDMGFGMGVRSKRFVMVIQENRVQKLIVDEGMEDCSGTSAEAVLELLRPAVQVNETPEMGGVALVGATVAAVVFGIATSFGDSTTTTTTAVVPPPPPPAATTAVSIMKAPKASETSFSLINEYLK